jgi:hypothetical protein
LERAPVAIELYPADQPDYIDLECVEPDERAEIAGMTVREAVDKVMQNYRRNSSANAAKADLDGIMKKGNDVTFSINGHILRAVRDPSGAIIADHTQERISDGRFFRPVLDDEKNLWWLCEIRVYEAKAHSLR